MPEKKIIIEKKEGGVETKQNIRIEKLERPNPFLTTTKKNGGNKKG